MEARGGELEEWSGRGKQRENGVSQQRLATLYLNVLSQSLSHLNA